MRTQREKMLAGDLYIASDPELQALSHRGKTIVRTYNETTEEQNDLRRQLLEQLWAKVGEHAYIEPPFHTDYGQHTEVGDNFYMNYDGIIIDVAPVKIGNNVMFGPRAGIYTAGHPIDAAIRNEASNSANRLPSAMMFGLAAMSSSILALPLAVTSSLAQDQLSPKIFLIMLSLLVILATCYVPLRQQIPSYGKRKSSAILRIRR